MNREQLASVLAEQFAAGSGERRAVCRQAKDLSASGQYERDAGVTLTPETIARNLADAPDGGLAARWNWWMGALELAYGGYARFQVRRFRGTTGRETGHATGRDSGSNSDEPTDDSADDRSGP